MCGVCVCDVFVRERRREEKCAMRGLCVRAGAGGAGVCAVFDEEERWDAFIQAFVSTADGMRRCGVVAVCEREWRMTTSV